MGDNDLWFAWPREAAIAMDRDEILLIGLLDYEGSITVYPALAIFG
jgi:hypothetical protein